MPDIFKGASTAAVASAVVLLLTATATAAVPDHPSVRVARVPSWVDVTAFDPAAPIDAPGAASSSVAYVLADFQILLDDRRIVEYSRIVTRVLTHAGLSHAAEQDISFDPGYQTLVIHHARVFREGAWSDRLADAEVTIAQRETDFSRRIYDGSLSVLAVLGDIRVGDVVDVAYSLKGFNPVFDGRYFTGLSMAWPSPVSTRRVRVLRLPEIPIFVRGFGGADSDGLERTIGDLVEHEWLLEDVEAIPYEASTPATWEAYPWIQLSQYESWSEIVDWALPLYRLPGSNREDIQARAAEITAGADSPEEQALAAVRWVQDELRYFAIVLGPNSHAPHPPSLTVKRRFGDCKDKALLLVALLTELGIPAWPALVDSSTGDQLPSRQPSPGAFDHVVVVAEIGGRERWIDPTISFQGGTIATIGIPDYGSGLMIRAGETAPAAIPVEQTDPGEIRAQYDYDFSDDGRTALVGIVTEFVGLEADSQRYDLADTTIEELQTGYLNYYSTATGRVIAVDPLEVEDDRLANTLITRESYRLEDWWIAVEGQPTFELLPLLLTNLIQTEDLGDRRAPLEIPRRYRRFESVRLRTPVGWDLSGVELATGDPWFDYRVTSSRDGQELRMDHQLVIGDHPVDSNEIGTFNSVVQDMKDAAYFSIVNDVDGAAGDITAAVVAISAVVAAATGIFALVGLMLFRWRLL